MQREPRVQVSGSEELFGSSELSETGSGSELSESSSESGSGRHATGTQGAACSKYRDQKICFDPQNYQNYQDPAGSGSESGSEVQ